MTKAEREFRECVCRGCDRCAVEDLSDCSSWSCELRFDWKRISRALRQYAKQKGYIKLTKEELAILGYSGVQKK